MASTPQVHDSSRFATTTVPKVVLLIRTGFASDWSKIGMGLSSGQ